MKIQIRSLILGFVLTCLLFLSVLAWLLLADGTPSMMDVQKQILPNGKIVNVTGFYLAWGKDHDEPYPEQDSFVLEYISAVPYADKQARDKEALEVFELIRPICEQWAFKQASMSAFPSAQRKGKYERLDFQQNPDGKWSFNVFLQNIWHSWIYKGKWRLSLG
jgi:hypothetical protein